MKKVPKPNPLLDLSYPKKKPGLIIHCSAKGAKILKDAFDEEGKKLRIKIKG